MIARKQPISRFWRAMPRPSHPRRLVLPPHLWRLRPLQLVIIDLSDWLFPWVALNVLWVVLSLTVVLAPPATAALFDAARRAYRNQPPDLRRFLRDLRRWFLPAWLWALPNVVVFAGLFLLARAAYPSEIPLAIIAVLAFLAVLLQFFFWPYMVLQEQPHILRALRNSAFTALGDLVYTLGYLVLSAFLLLTSAIVIAPLLLIAPVLLALMTTYGLAAWLERHQLLQGEPREL
jgi:uncharacterized membrane protein YesL